MSDTNNEATALFTKSARPRILHFFVISLALCLTVASPAISAEIPGTGADKGKTVIYRDTWGVSHIYAPTMEAGAPELEPMELRIIVIGGVVQKICPDQQVRKKRDYQYKAYEQPEYVQVRHHAAGKRLW